MNLNILDKDVQAFIKANRERSPSEIALSKSPFQHVSSSEIATQIDGWQRAVKKLPTWAFTSNIYYPDKINLEQCSSEHTALVKQTLIKKGAKVADITGGFSVDSCYIAQEASTVIHCEINKTLSAIVKHNTKVLGVNNLVALPVDGVDFVKNQKDESLDYIYIDPSRRVNSAKVFLLEDCEPNILNYQDLFLQKARFTLIKLSPLLDINALLNNLKHVKLVYVISVDGDCKELLLLQDRTFTGEPKIVAIRLVLDKIQEVAFTFSEERACLIKTGDPLKYLYDPDVAITKAGAFKTIAKVFNLSKLNINTHLYTSNIQEIDFPGKTFLIEKTYSFNEFKQQKSIKKANIVSKNFPMKVEEIKKKFKIKDGGEVYLYFTCDTNNKHIVIKCFRIE